MKIILCGYHWTGCKALQHLLELGYEVFVYTHDNPYHIPSLIDLCIKNNVRYSTENVSELILPFKPDAICSIYYRYIIKEHIINACNGRIFNLHPALLPKYRGCSSLTWALINGEKYAGFTFHYIDKNIDTGEIIIQKKVKIEDFDNQGTLYNRVMFKAMEYFEEALRLVLKKFEGIDQSGESSHFKRGCPHDGIINPKWDDMYVERFIRAMIYPPYSNAYFKDKEITTFKNYLELKQRLI